MVILLYLLWYNANVLYLVRINSALSCVTGDVSYVQPIHSVAKRRNDIISSSRQKYNFKHDQVYKRNGDVMMTTKAYNARVITSWLATCLKTASESPDRFPDPRYPLAATCMFLAGYYHDFYVTHFTL